MNDITEMHLMWSKDGIVSHDFIYAYCMWADECDFATEDSYWFADYFAMYCMASI